MALVVTHHISTIYKLLKELTFKSVMENELLSIDQQVSSIRVEIVSQNRKTMKCMAETAILVVGRELPFVGTEMIGSM